MSASPGLVTMAMIGWVDPDIYRDRAVVEGNWLFLKPIYTQLFMTRHFPFIDPKIQNELDFEKWPPAQSLSSDRLARARNNTFAFLPQRF